MEIDVVKQLKKRNFNTKLIGSMITFKQSLSHSCDDCDLVNHITN